MKITRFTSVLLLVCATAVITLFLISSKSALTDFPETPIKEWSVRWIQEDEPKQQTPSLTGSWQSRTIDNPQTAIPDGVVGVWVHIQIPPTTQWMSPGLMVDRFYGLNISVYEGNRLVYQSKRDFYVEQNHLLLPLSIKSDASDLFVRIESKRQAGPNSVIHIGEFSSLSNYSDRRELPDVLLGASIAFLGLIMLLCSGYLNRKQRSSWIALSLIALSTGILMGSYSAFPFISYPGIGKPLMLLFDLSMDVLFPTLYYFVIPIFEGDYVILKKVGFWLNGYFAFCFILTILYNLIGEPIFFYYQLFTLWIMAPMILLQLVLFIILSIINAFKGNKDSVILSTGIFLLALSGVTDLVLYFISKERHIFFYWKIGVVCMIATLIVLLASRISADYKRLLSYSKELELHNRQIQKAEKIKILSDLAASIAHEVRNPMQVTRGFLQLLSNKSDAESKVHFKMAINELDRASAIITDFLTFAKPELDTVVRIDLRQELSTIETIMCSMVAMHQGVLRVRVPENLHILGNPSKFKQAFINLIKNSIESLRDEGIIEIDAWAEANTVVIRIKDNGEGMCEDQIAKLGEPYFSTKTKGTGLGLMVTFRLIELMKGTLEFRSAIGKGTEAIVRFPLAEE
ncbi:sensor histidine kinase [Gorillibacterium massiliense]|uniref:sensor histidine kinase n=1 Tax=Gorillibacterium massiliense TaxID=1280390 RepID=UPI000694614D|nr:sensor histidine kinase [Gorillibacterium massiliense]